MGRYACGIGLALPCAIPIFSAPAENAERVLHLRVEPAKTGRKRLPCRREKRFTGQSKRVRALPSLRKQTLERARHDLLSYRFHRRLQQKWACRIDQIVAVTGRVTPPRAPSDDDDDENKVEEDKDRFDQSAVMGEPDE